MSLHTKVVKSQFVSLLISICLILSAGASHAQDDLVSVFPLDHYNQTLAAWFPPEALDFDKPLLSVEMQNKRFAQFLEHYVGDVSPWNEAYINKLLQEPSPNTLQEVEQSVINKFDNQGKSAEVIGYGANFRPYDAQWITQISDNINVAQLANLTYQSNNRGIATKNLFARALPTDDVFYYDFKIAGQGYPFDNLQMSAVWAGAPVYIFAESRDHEWLLVATAELIGWVKSSGIARTDDAFVNNWTVAAKTKLAAIVHTKTNMSGFNSYVGAVYPEVVGAGVSSEKTLLVPVMDENHNAKITTVTVPAQNAVTAPLAMTTHNVSFIMSTLIGRTYGWGNSEFNNDCSAELKNMLAPFGIWLPRNSAWQASAGNTVDLSGESTENRINYLMKNGHKLLTLITIPGHIMLYVGNFINPNQPTTLMAMTYQNMWGLKPNPPARRAVVGKAVLFPLLPSYPEDTTLMSQASFKIFRLTYLDESPEQGSSKVNLINSDFISLKELMLP